MKPNAEKSLIFAIMLVCALFRVVNLESIPAWHWDEGVNLNIASNLLEGESRWFSLRYLWIPHPPMYYAVAASVIKVLGESIAAIRVLSILYALATTYLLYLIGRRVSVFVGYLAPLFHALHPAAIYW